MKTQIEIPLNSQTLITPKQTAEILGIAVETLSIWRATHRYNLPYIKIGGRVKYRPNDIQDFIRSRTMLPNIKEGK